MNLIFSIPLFLDVLSGFTVKRNVIRACILYIDCPLISLVKGKHHIFIARLSSRFRGQEELEGRRQKRNFNRAYSCGLPSLAQTPPVRTSLCKDALLPNVSCALAGKQLWAAQPTWKYGLGSTFTRTLLIFVELCI